MTYKSQKTELAESRALLNDQNSNLRLQRFETTFFNLLNLHHTIVNGIDLIISSKKENISNKEPRIKHGRDCFVTFFEGFKTAYQNKKKKDAKLDEEVLIREAYHDFFEKHQYDLGHYFKNLYHIVKFVHNSNIEDKQVYISLVRAQLSSHELLVLFYNCLSEYGIKFKPLVIQYEILDGLPDLLIQEGHIKFYQKVVGGWKSTM